MSGVRKNIFQKSLTGLERAGFLVPLKINPYHFSLSDIWKIGMTGIDKKLKNVLRKEEKMIESISNVTLLDTLKTDDGERVPPGIYPVTRVCLREGKSGMEKDLFYLKGFDGICIERTRLYVLKHLGKVDFSFV